MKSRFAPVKRPLLALTALVVLASTAGMMASHAVSVNNLSAPGSIGTIRVHPVFANRSGVVAFQLGDPNIPESNPNRTVGDVPFGDPDYRQLGINDVSINASAADGHSHYHVGDTAIVVNEVSGFRAGDTVLIGTPYCNHALLGLTCKKFFTGQGIVNEQPFGEVAHIVGGDVAIGDSGPGVLQLAEPLSLDNSGNNSSACIGYADCSHEAGEQIVKLPTGYQGQQFRVDIPHVDLLNGSANGVTVNAEFVAPQGSHNPSFPRRPLALDRDHQNGPFITSVAAASTGFTSFYIPNNITGNATIGNTFSVDSPDTWYTVIITAKDAVTNAVVADGVARFKLNPVGITSLKSDRETATAPGDYFPTEAATITGTVRDESSAAALNRPVEDVIIDGDITKPDGSVNHYQTTSCVDTDPTAADLCGGNLFLGPGDNHGNFQLKIGGPQGLFVSFDIQKATLNNGDPFGPVFSLLDTFDTGSYDVVATARGLIPAVTATDTFNVSFP